MRCAAFFVPLQPFMIKRLFLLTIIALLQCAAAQAQNETPNARQARRIFNQVYDKVFGQQGSTLTYDVNIIGIYKTHGTIWMKGKKQKFVDEKVNTWNDGTTAYMCYRKRKTVEIHHANSDKKDKYSGRFKFSLDDFNYSIAKDPEGLLITLKQKKKAKGTIKEVRALISEPELEPVRLRIKVAFFWTTVNISNFKSGGITDDLFVFPRKNYQEGWKFVDKRKD